MKFITDNYILILAFLSSAAMLFWPLIKDAKTKLTVADAVQLMNREKGVLIDVSNADEFAAAHARGSKNLPLAEMANLSKHVKSKDQPVIFICPQGKRAATAAAAAQKLGYARALAITGGLKAWRDALMPVEKAA